jgi:hypothetical protein
MAFSEISQRYWLDGYCITVVERKKDELCENEGIEVEAFYVFTVCYKFHRCTRLGSRP